MREDIINYFKLYKDYFKEQDVDDFFEVTDECQIMILTKDGGGGKTEYIRVMNSGLVFEADQGGGGPPRLFEGVCGQFLRAQCP